MASIAARQAGTRGPMPNTSSKTQPSRPMSEHAANEACNAWVPAMSPTAATPPASRRCTPAMTDCRTSSAVIESRAARTPPSHSKKCSGSGIRGTSVRSRCVCALTSAGMTAESDASTHVTDPPGTPTDSGDPAATTVRPRSTNTPGAKHAPRPSANHAARTATGAATESS